MDLKDINSVQDLLRDNNESTDDWDSITRRENRAELTKPIYEQEPEVGMEVAIDIIENLLCFHSDAVQDYLERNETEKCAVWAADLTKLQIALSILREVQL